MQGFLSTLSLRRATQPPPLLIVELTSFYPRSPCGERHAKPWRKYHTADVSIHALLAESDRMAALTTFPALCFYPRSPCGERHVACGYWHKLHRFYPRSPCGERLTMPDLCQRYVRVSIHALLAESDLTACIASPARKSFYPRSPCGERQDIHIIWACMSRFLSTLSLRRATEVPEDQYTALSVSIHALLAESDYRSYNLCSYDPRFLSTLSLRRATRNSEPGGNLGSGFYPRSPCGERPRACRALSPRPCFYPRSPCGERRIALYRSARVLYVSIHALLAESDRAYQRYFAADESFYPRSPCGERPFTTTITICTVSFLSTLSLRRATPPFVT